MNSNVVRTLAIGAAALVLEMGCQRRNEVVVYTSVDQVVAEPILDGFEKQFGVRVRAVFDTEETKSTGVLNRLIAEGGRPQADVFWSGDPVRPFLLVNRGFVEAYRSPNAHDIPPSFKAANGEWSGFAARARVLIVNKNLVPSDPPKSIRDLIHVRWKDKAAIANPLFGTTTMHVAALFAVWGDEKTRAFLNALRANGVRVASSNGEVKRLVSGGEVAFGLTDTDDADEALKEGAPIQVVYPDQDELGTLLMPTTVLLMKGDPHPDLGKKLIDYLLTRDVERGLAESAAHLPVRAGIPTPADVRAATSLRFMDVDYGKVGAELERIQPWLREWVGL
ncbi:MAG TPA: extracellular solute-binding protein [Polyangiaceae bacterium]